MPIRLIEVQSNSAAGWAEMNPKTIEGAIYTEGDTGKLKIGDGESRYNDLPYSAVPGV